MRLEHVWVEAAIDFHPSRGAINRAADSWIPMDPSFKQYDYLEGLDPIAISGIDPEQLANDFLASGSVDENGDWVTGFDPTVLQNAQAEAQQALEDHIEQNLPDATVGDVLGGRKIIEQQLPILAGTLENRIVLTGNRYAALPQNLQQRMTFGFQDAYGSSLGSVSYPFAEVNNQRITLSFKPATQADEDALASLLPEGEITDISQLPTSIPAYLINVVPELKVGDNVVLTGNSMTLGEEITFRFTPEFAGRYGIPNTYNVIAGSYLAIAAIAGNVNPEEISNSRAKVLELKTRYENGIGDDAPSREETLGLYYHSGILAYYSQLLEYGEYGARFTDSSIYLAAGVGSFGYEPNVSYTFGIPKSISTGGDVFNLPMIHVSGFDGQESESNAKFVKSFGLLSSALEHIVPEQLNPDREPDEIAVSAIRLLALASKDGQRVFRIDQSNADLLLSNVEIADAAYQEISTAINAGKYALVHESPLQITDWKGSGYIVIDPNFGDGAYKISGGSNGGRLKAGFLDRLKFNGGVFGPHLFKKWVSKLLPWVGIAQILYDLYAVMQKCKYSVYAPFLLTMVITLFLIPYLLPGLSFAWNLFITWSMDRLSGYIRQVAMNESC